MQIEIGSIDDVVLIDSQVPEFENNQSLKSKIKQRLKNKANLIIIVRVDGELAGYKIGYEVSKNIFYSWLGAVLPKFRKLGVATQLREYQEAWVKKAGYSEIEVKSMNRFPAMLKLLISSGYRIHGYENGAQKADGKILFSKILS